MRKQEVPLDSLGLNVPATREELEEFARRYVDSRRAKYGPMQYEITEGQDGRLRLSFRRLDVN
jgi:hypothetical protein